jgi:hypothetical protein
LKERFFVAKKRSTEVPRDKKRPSAKYFRLHPRHEQAVKTWVELHGADETIVYKVGAFLFMTLPIDQRVKATRRYLEWAHMGYPSEALNWPDMEEGRLAALDAGRDERYPQRVGEIEKPAST